MEHLKEIGFVQNVENVAYLLNKISAEKGIERDELVAEIHAVKSFVKGANGVFEKVVDISD